jgi:hypothetical protein
MLAATGIAVLCAMATAVDWAGAMQATYGEITPGLYLGDACGMPALWLNKAQ